MMTPPPVTPEEGTKMGRNVTVLASAQLITWTMTLAWTLVVPRALGPSGLGTIMAAWSITGILGVVLGLGTRNYLVRESVVRPGAAPQLIGTALVLRVVLSPLLIAASFAYGQVAGWDHDAKLVLYLAAAATIFVQIAEPLQAGFQATERMEYLAYSDIISKSGQGLVGIVVVLLGFGTIGVTACWALMTGIVVVLDLYWLHGLVRIDWRTNISRMLAVAKASVPYWAFGLFFMLYLWIDFVMLSLLTTNEVVGWYAVPTRLFQTLMFLPVAVATAWLPHFVRGFEESDEKLREAARQPVELVLLLSLPIAALTAALSGPVIHFLYGSDYAESVPVMAILGLCIPAMYMNIMLSQVLIAMNRQTTWTWVMGVTTIINPLFNLALIPLTQHRYDNGAIGAAISLLLTEIIVVAAGIWLIGRRVFDGGSVRRTALGLAAATAAGVAAYLSQAMINWVLAAAIGIVVFAGAAALLRVFTPGEIELMRQGLQKVMRRIPGLKRFADRRPRGPDLISTSREPLGTADRTADSPTKPLAGPERGSRDAAREAERRRSEGLDAEPGGA
jgi:O-antigen/teichoic acid export membrane protein